MNWTTNVTIALDAKRRGKVMNVGVTNTGKSWMVLAVEAPTVRARSILKKTEAVFANHGHAVVGDFKSLAQAMLAAEAFAAKWKKGTAIGKCGCKEIGK